MLCKGIGGVGIRQQSLVSNCEWKSSLQHVLTTCGAALAGRRDNEARAEIFHLPDSYRSMSARLLALLLLLAPLAQAWGRDDPPPRMRGPAREMEEPRRERLRESRETFRSMREQLREQSQRDGNNGRRAAEEDDSRGPRGPMLRRLEPEERERLRRAMRDAAKEHYGR